MAPSAVVRPWLSESRLHHAGQERRRQRDPGQPGVAVMPLDGQERQQRGDGTLVQVVNHVRRGEEGEPLPLSMRHHGNALVDHLSLADQQWCVAQAFSLVVAVSLLAASPPVVATAVPPPGGSVPSPASGTVQVISRAAQNASRAFWMASRMKQATATKATTVQGTTGQGGTRAAGPPPGTPTATPFGGVPTIGALFYTTRSGKHFCTASVCGQSARPGRRRL